jgi:hypothetical protein
MMFPQIRRWDLVVMFSLMAAMFTFELIGVSSTRMVTITQIIKAYTPMPIRIMVYSWLGWHFIISDLVKQIAPSP